MGQKIRVTKTCDRCPAEYGVEEIDSVEAFNEKERSKVVFTMDWKGEHIAYADLCPSCTQTLGNLFLSAKKQPKVARKKTVRKSKKATVEEKKNSGSGKKAKGEKKAATPPPPSPPPAPSKPSEV